MDIKKILLGILLLCAISMSAQQPQTIGPIQSANAKYVQGVAPGYWPTPGSALTLNIAPGTVMCASVVVTYSGGTLPLADNTTNYIYLNTSASCIPAHKTTAFTSSDIPIAVVTTASGSIITPITNDLRLAPSGGNGGPIQEVCTGTISLPTSSITNGTKYGASSSTPLQTTCTGMLTTDRITLTFNADPTSTTGYSPGNMLTIIDYPDSGGGVIDLYLINNTASPITPGAATVNYQVTR
jgi:hypothetical protein